MKIVVDESVDRCITARLAGDGHDVIDIARTDSGVDDEAVLLKAISEHALLVTEVKDFGELVFRLHRAKSC